MAGRDHIAPGQCLPNGSRRHGATLDPGRRWVGHQRKREDFEPVLATEFGQQANVPLAVLSELEVVTDYHSSGPQAIDQHSGHEVLGPFSRTLMVETDHHNRVDTSRFQQAKLLVEIGEQSGSQIGAQDGGRMGIERHDRGGHIQPLGGPGCRVDHPPVPEVDAVEDADGDGVGTIIEGRGPHRSASFRIIDDAH